MKEENRKAVALNDDDLDAVTGGRKKSHARAEESLVDTIIRIANEEPVIEKGRPTPTLNQPDNSIETGRPTPTLKQ